MERLMAAKETPDTEIGLDQDPMTFLTGLALVKFLKANKHFGEDKAFIIKREEFGDISYLLQGKYNLDEAQFWIDPIEEGLVN